MRTLERKIVVAPHLHRHISTPTFQGKRGRRLSDPTDPLTSFTATFSHNIVSRHTIASPGDAAEPRRRAAHERDHEVNVTSSQRSDRKPLQGATVAFQHAVRGRISCRSFVAPSSTFQSVHEQYPSARSSSGGRRRAVVRHASQYQATHCPTSQDAQARYFRDRR